MALNSYGFFMCLFVAAAGYYALPPKCRPWLLLGYSYTFYWWWKPAYAVLLALATLLVYSAGALLPSFRSDRGRRAFFWSAIAGLVALLAFFKYLKACHPWLIAYLPSDWHLTSDRAASLIIPLGISFYTFKMIAYLADVYLERDEPERSLVALAAHFAFFPHVLSGPIQRSRDFVEQVREPTSLQSRLVLDGMLLIAFGFLRKLVADLIDPLIEPVFREPRHFRGIVCLLSAYLFTAQLYLDFSGYTSIALGIGNLFGIRAPENFQAPLLACNVQDFWQRWHRTLTTWLKDYVFLPLCMTFRSLKQAGVVLAVVVNMVLIGIWHDFKATFVIFGLLHALFLATFLLTASLRKRFLAPVPFAGVLGWLVTFHLVVLAFVYFRAPTIADANLLLKNLQIFSLDRSLLPATNTLLAVVAGAVLVGNLIEKGRLRAPRSEAACYGLLSVALMVLYFYAESQPTSFLYQRY
jgi:D-alanyl-lipoteichoic acid acyltransferase DltB (MBOAT superfamily)